MHSTIYQLGTSPISEDEYMNPETISEGESVCIGYADEIVEAERKSQMEELVEILPKGMFTLNNDLTLTYNGGINEWRHHYARLIRERAEAIDTDNVTEWTGPVYQLQKAITILLTPTAFSSPTSAPTLERLNTPQNLCASWNGLRPETNCMQE